MNNFAQFPNVNALLPPLSTIQLLNQFSGINYLYQFSKKNLIVNQPQNLNMF